MTNKELVDMPFNEIVDTLAGDALLKLIRGEQWRGIIWYVCQAMVQWDVAQEKKAKKK